MPLCICASLHSQALKSPFCLPAANLLAPHRHANSAATGRLFVWLCHYWIETRRLGGREARMAIDALWTVHLLNLWPSWTVFRLGRQLQTFDSGLGQSACGWDVYCWNTGRSEAKLCILSGPQCWLANSLNGERLNKHGKRQNHLHFKDTEMCMNT